MTDKRDMTIFVVDDDESVRRALKRLIKSSGLKVETFASAREFLKHGGHRRSGILVLDVRMPGMSGLELKNQLTALGAEIPVIFITAHEDAQVTEMALVDGAVAFLQKPFDDRTLLDAIYLGLDHMSKGLSD